MKKKETDYYREIGEELVNIFQSNLPAEDYTVSLLFGEVSSSLRTLSADAIILTPQLRDFTRTVQMLHTDIAVLVQNRTTAKYELIIFEIKKTKALGLSELSQLIGYCLVSRAGFGILVNVDHSIGRNLSVMLDADPHLSEIKRMIGDNIIRHFFGVMVWNSHTRKMEYTGSGRIKRIPELTAMLREALE